MDIDALHSALFSLTIAPEQIRSARENVSAANGGASSTVEEFLGSTERDLRIAKATLARELGFPICACCWPPELLAMDADGNTYCPASSSTASALEPVAVERVESAAISNSRKKSVRLDSFTRLQKKRLLHLRDTVVDSITGVTKGNLSAGASGAIAASFVGDRADAGNDASEHDFALSLLAQENDALKEIDDALKRIEQGIYGICQMSGQPVPRARLEVIPFARCTVECQSRIEKQGQVNSKNRSVSPAFALVPEDETDEEQDPQAEREPTTLADRIVVVESAEAALHPRLVANEFPTGRRY